MSPAMAGGFLTTAPPGKSRQWGFDWRGPRFLQFAVAQKGTWSPAMTGSGNSCSFWCCPESKGHPVLKGQCRDVSGSTVVKNPPANAGDTGSSPGPGRSHMLRSN